MDHFFTPKNYNHTNENNTNHKISLDELYDRKREIDSHRLIIYNKILGRVHIKIKTASRVKDNNHYTFFIVPEFIFGVPKYNIDTCISYIIDKLTDNGFLVKYTHPNLLFISWSHYIPSHEREIIKRETGIAIDGFGNEIKKKDKNVSFASITNTNDTSTSSNNDKLVKNYKDISTYKPSGIYNIELINKIQDKITKK